MRVCGCSEIRLRYTDIEDNCLLIQTQKCGLEVFHLFDLVNQQSIQDRIEPPQWTKNVFVCLNLFWRGVCLFVCFCLFVVVFSVSATTSSVP